MYWRRESYKYFLLLTGCVVKKITIVIKIPTTIYIIIMGFNKNGCCLIAGSTDVSSSESRASMCLPIATVAYAESAHKIITTKIAAQVSPLS